MGAVYIVDPRNGEVADESIFRLVPGHEPIIEIEWSTRIGVSDCPCQVDLTGKFATLMGPRSTIGLA